MLCINTRLYSSMRARRSCRFVFFTLRSTFSPGIVSAPFYTINNLHSIFYHTARLVFNRFRQYGKKFFA